APLPDRSTHSPADRRPFQPTRARLGRAGPSGTSRRAGAATRTAWIRPARRSGRGRRRRQERRAAGLEHADRLSVPESEADVVQALHEPPTGEVVELERRDDASAADLTGTEVDSDLDGRVSLDGGQQRLDGLGRQDDGQQPVAERVAAEDVGELGPDDGAEAIVL